MNQSWMREMELQITAVFAVWEGSSNESEISQIIPEEPGKKSRASTLVCVSIIVKIEHTCAGGTDGKWMDPGTVITFCGATGKVTLILPTRSG